MKAYLIDVNLPRNFAPWNNEEYEHVVEINDEWKDSEIWSYAKENNLTIVTKDADFSELILLNDPPPKIIHIKGSRNNNSTEFAPKFRSGWVDLREHSRKRSQAYVEDCASKERPKMT